MSETRSVKVTLKVLIEDDNHCSGECPFLGDFIDARNEVIKFRCDLFKAPVTMDFKHASDNRIKRLDACRIVEQGTEPGLAWKYVDGGIEAAYGFITAKVLSVDGRFNWQLTTPNGQFYCGAWDDTVLEAMIQAETAARAAVKLHTHSFHYGVCPCGEVDPTQV